MATNYKIGHVYKFGYTPLHESRKVEDPIVCSLSADEQKLLIESLVYGAEKTAEAFKKKQEDFNVYYNMVNELERMVAKRQKKGDRKKTAEEVDLERRINAMKKIYFRRKTDDEKKLIPPVIKARNLFFRNYLPKQIDNSKDSTMAVYAGKDISSNGNVTYRWYVLNPVPVSKKMINKEIKPFITIQE